MINMFYAEPESDRWFPFDRYPRRVARRLWRGTPQPGGMKRYFLNLVAGLHRAEIPVRVNDVRYALNHPEEAIGIVGKGQLLRARAWRNPIVFGPAVFSHPLVDIGVFHEVPIKTVLVSCEWLQRMYTEVLDVPVMVCAAGVDTNLWNQWPNEKKQTDFLIYDKIRWHRGAYERDLLSPIRKILDDHGFSYSTIKYGEYRETDFRASLASCAAMVFLCEHETQGFAYLQALASGIPILAWDRGGTWEDPEFYPERVIFKGVSSVPYWDDRCGLKFRDASDFSETLRRFWATMEASKFKPRDYVTEKLSLESCARDYAGYLQEAGRK